VPNTADELIALG